MNNKNFLEIHFTIVAEEQNDLLIAMLADIGFTGFEEELNGLKAFIAADEFNQQELDEIIKTVPVAFSKTLIREQNWNAKWESSFEPIIVNDSVHRTPWVAIRAGFHKPMPGIKHEIIITPKMSFGTGHHATTYLVIEQMLAIDFVEKTVLDFGTGTGILAIFAEKMGASSITAIDNDEWSIENAKENLASNDCKKIKLQKAETIPTIDNYDIILANINLNVILANITAIAHACKPGGYILLSGFLQPDEHIILEAITKNGLISSGSSQRGDWICVVAQLQNS